MQYIGTASHFISAIMQMLGLYYQGVILTDYQKLIETIGALFFVVGLAMGLISIALFGNYKRAIYFAIAPALFYMMLRSTVPASDPEVKFGKITHKIDIKGVGDSSALLNMFEDNIIGSKDNIKVSWFFAQFDNLVTAVIHRLVDILVDTDNREQIIAQARENLISRVLDMKSIKMGFLQMLAAGLTGECAEMSSKAASKAGRTDETYFGEAANNRINLSENIVDYLRSDEMSGIAPELQNVMDKSSVTVTCSRLWEITLKAAEVEVNEYLDALEKELEKKHSAKDNTGKADSDSWKRALRQVLNNIKNPKSVSGAEGAGRDAVLVKKLAALLIKNSVRPSMHAAMTNQLFQNNPTERMITGVSTSVGANIADIAESSRLAYFSSAIYYIQGFLLMILCMVFPFFCLFLLIPSKATSFLIWLSLWVWVKSWDLGFAILVVIKDFLWQFFTQNAAAKLEATNKEGVDRLSSIFNFITDEDEIATPFLYTSITSILTLAVPVFMGHLCLGASNLFKFLSLASDSTTNAIHTQTRAAEARQWATAAEHMMKIRGLTEEGRSVAHDIYDNPPEDRTMTGDASMGVYMKHLSGAMAQMGYKQSQEMDWLQNIRSISDTRKTKRDIGDIGNDSMDAWIMLQMMKEHMSPQYWEKVEGAPAPESIMEKPDSAAKAGSTPENPAHDGHGHDGDGYDGDE